MFAFVCTVAGHAESVSRAEALRKAKSFMQDKGMDMSRQMTEATRAPRRKSGHADASCYYVFNADKVFVIVSGDDRTMPVLGYSLSGSFNPDSIPDNMRAWLQGYADLIDNLDSLGVTAKYEYPSSSAVPAKMVKSADGRLQGMPAMAPKRVIKPLLTSTWNQDAPYWDNCPLQEYNGSYYHTYTGCAATAMAQVVNYHKYPDVISTDMPSYVTRTYGIEVQGVPAGSVIDWDNMADDYTNYRYMTTESKQAVANLMRYCGVALEMNYTIFESGAYTSSTVPAFKKFGYDENIYRADRSNYTISEWNALLCNELLNNRPLFYDGQSTGGGHAFVIDGYDGELYHVNWGWGGSCDGYFAVSVLNPHSTEGIGASSTPDGYSMGQGAIIGVQPPGSPNPVGPNNFDKMMTSFLRVDNTNVIFDIYNATGKTNVFDVALVIKNMTTGAEFQSLLVEGAELQNNYGWSDIHYDMTGWRGTYKIYPVSRISGTEEWLYDHDAERFYALLVADKNGIQKLELHPMVNIEATDFIVPSNPSVGNAQVIKTTVKNNGDEFNGTLYFFKRIEGEDECSLFSRTGVAIPQDGEVETEIHITPDVYKNHHIYVVVDKNNDGEVDFNTEVIGECMLTFDGGEPVVNLQAVSAAMYNDPIVGEEFRFYVTIQNNGDDYSGPLHLFHASERMIQEEGKVWRGMSYDNVSIAAGKTVDVDFSFVPDEAGANRVYISTTSDVNDYFVWFGLDVAGGVTDVDGDINGDGRLDVTDLVTLSKYIADGDATHVQTDKADLNGDGRITVADVVELARRIANQ